MNTLLGSKQKMTAVYKDATRVPVTLVTAGPCVVTEIRHFADKGYWTLQIGFGSKKQKNTSKALLGHLKNSLKDKKYAPAYIQEVKVTEEPTQKVGDMISLTDIFAVGDTVAVTGTSKGKGFAGVVKRWNFAGGPKTHGQSDRHRAPGSIGQGTTPGRVYKGKHMAGRMGGDRKTIANLEIMSLDAEKNTLEISGALPGTIGSFLIIKKTNV